MQLVLIVHQVHRSAPTSRTRHQLTGPAQAAGQPVRQGKVGQADTNSVQCSVVAATLNATHLYTSFLLTGSVHLLSVCPVVEMSGVPAGGAATATGAAGYENQQQFLEHQTIAAQRKVDIMMYR